jgi:hypothetical protein
LILALLSRLAVVAWGDRCAWARVPRRVLANDPLVAAPNLNYNARHLAALALPARRLVQPWYRWDAIWYAELSQAGYDYDPIRQSTTAFMPLLPMLMAAGALVGLDRYWVGLVAVNLAFAAGLACFGRAVLRTTGDPATTWRTCLLLAAYPYALFFSAPYQESLGFALTSAAILAWTARRPIAAGASLALASLARLTTVAMCLGLVAEWLDAKLHHRPVRNSAWLVALSGGLGFGLFCVYLTLRFGDPFVHFRAHASWGRHPADVRNVAWMLGLLVQQAFLSRRYLLPSLAILAWTCQGPVRAGLSGLWAPTARKRPSATITAGDYAGNIIAVVIVIAALSAFIPNSPTTRIGLDLIRWSDSISCILFLGLGIHAWWRRGPLWGCLVFVPILQGLATGTALSLNRILLMAFPAFVDLAELLRPRLAFWAWILGSILLEGRLVYLFVNWQFIG